MKCEKKRKVKNELKIYDLNKGLNKMENTVARTGLESKLEAQFWTLEFDSLVRHLSGEIMW